MIIDLATINFAGGGSGGGNGGGGTITEINAGEY